MPPRRKKDEFGEISFKGSGRMNPLDEVWDALDPKGFSEEAKAHFRVFIREAEVTIDNRIIDPDAFPWLDPIYDLRRDDILANKYKDGIAFVKPAQVGATVAMLLFIMWVGTWDEGMNIGFFFPAQDTLYDLIKTRIVPAINSSEMLSEMAEGQPASLSARKLGNATIYFRYTKGVGQVDTFPMNIRIGDERRLMADAVMEGADYRLTQQDVQMKWDSSTAGQPNDAMERAFEKSNQLRWHTRCEGCHCTDEAGRPGLVLDLLEPPEFIRRREEPILGEDGEVESEYEYYCKHTGLPIDPTRGEYIAHNPKSRRLGLRIGSMVSPRVSADKLWDRYTDSTDRKEFYNASLGRAHFDPVGALLLSSHFELARTLGHSVAPVAEWLREQGTMQLYAGADVRHEECHLVVGQSDRLVWLEVLQGPNIFHLIEDRIRELGIVKLAIDREPETMDTEALARRNKRVVLVDYAESDEMVRWRKEGKDHSVKDPARRQKTLLLDRTLSLKYALGELAQGRVAMPPGKLLQQGVRNAKGRLVDSFDVVGEFEAHLKSLVLVRQPRKMKVENQLPASVAGALVEEVVNYGPDHFAHAYSYFRMLLNIDGQGARIIPAGPPRQDESSNSRSPEARERSCGGCRRLVSREDGKTPVEEGIGLCTFLGMPHAASDAACTIPRGYIPRAAGKLLL